MIFDLLFQHHELEEFFIQELRKNRVETIELLLDTGFDIKIIEYIQLGQLYDLVGLY